LRGKFEFEPVKNDNRHDNEDDKKVPLSVLNSKNLYGYDILIQKSLKAIWRIAHGIKASPRRMNGLQKIKMLCKKI
jgi:hypothetical protein